MLGQTAAVADLVTAYLARGHVLLEGVPGVAKTLAARSIASALGLSFARIQFTPDLMPSDVVGTSVFHPARGEFETVRGPIFTEVLVADEINRTPPKTQAALLEAMEERQVTLDGKTHPLSPSFFVVATQNPIELEGTYPLPEAQLDRFLMRVRLGYPDEAAERAMLTRFHERKGQPPVVERAVSVEELEALHEAASTVRCDASIVQYVTALGAGHPGKHAVEAGRFASGSAVAPGRGEGARVLERARLRDTRRCEGGRTRCAEPPLDAEGRSRGRGRHGR